MTTFRVTQPTEEELNNIKQLLDKHGGQYIVTREVGTETEKEHIHGVVQHNLKDNTFRQALKRCLTDKGNEKYSCKKIYDLEGILRYVCKDGVVVYQQGFTEKTPEQYRKEFWAQNATEKKKKRNAHWLDELAIELRSKGKVSTYDMYCAVYHRCPCPTDFAIQCHMAKLKRMLNPEEAMERQWIRICDKVE